MEIEPGTYRLRNGKEAIVDEPCTGQIWWIGTIEGGIPATWNAAGEEPYGHMRLDIVERIEKKHGE